MAQSQEPVPCSGRSDTGQSPRWLVVLLHSHWDKGPVLHPLPPGSVPSPKASHLEVKSRARSRTHNVSVVAGMALRTVKVRPSWARYRRAMRATAIPAPFLREMAILAESPMVFTR